MNTDIRLDAAVFFALLFCLGSAIYILAFVAIPDKNMTLFAAIVGGVIGSGVTTFINWRWGSSKTSSTKDDTINQLTTQVSNGQDHPP